MASSEIRYIYGIIGSVASSEIRYTYKIIESVASSEIRYIYGVIESEKIGFQTQNVVLLM